jgi:hypothetical protein
MNSVQLQLKTESIAQRMTCLYLLGTTYSNETVHQVTLGWNFFKHKCRNNTAYQYIKNDRFITMNILRRTIKFAMKGVINDSWLSSETLWMQIFNYIMLLCWVAIVNGFEQVVYFVAVLLWKYLLPFSWECFIFHSPIKTPKYSNLQNSDFVSCFKWMWNLVFRLK